jgi:site-specific DNA-methyltransferase (adenine-specific)
MNLLPAFTASKHDDLSAFENRVFCADALDLLRALPDASVDLIATDPPYFKVKNSAWDNQWDTASGFIEWFKTILAEYKRVLKPNGSLYLFASPRMGSRVEVAVSEYFNVLNRITWAKPTFSTKAEMFDKNTMRGYFPSSEVIIFAEHGNGDEIAACEAGYHAEYNEAKRQLRFNILAEYLQSELDRAGIERKEIAALFPSKTGNLTGCVSNWLLGYNIPTPEQYHAIRDYLNTRAQSSDYLRREYEDLRREYEDLRRPFNASPHRPYTDVWTFKTVHAYEGKHECEKPLAMMKHIIETSSRTGAVVLDTFTGSGATLDAARQLGRRYIGCDSLSQWTESAARRVSLPYEISLFDYQPEFTPTLPDGTKQLSLFEGVAG